MEARDLNLINNIAIILTAQNVILDSLTNKSLTPIRRQCGYVTPW